MKHWKRVTISIIGGILVTSIVIVVQHIYPERADSTMIRYLWMPGLFLAAIVLPGGIHDGISFICLAVGFTVVIYALVIYGLLGLRGLLEKT